LPEVSTLSDNPLAEALHDNTQTPPDEQCAFRIDFPAWRLTRAERDRRVLDDLMLGGRTLEVAGKYGLSPGRVSQLRREFLADWRRSCGALPPPSPAAVCPDTQQRSWQGQPPTGPATPCPEPAT